MNDISDVLLELLRAGPAHNQLLSPSTPYIALCGAAAPQTVQQPYEHHELLTRLDRLRYRDHGSAHAATQRRETLRELGKAMGELFGSVPALQSALGGGRDGDGRLVHLRLALAGLELGLLPFEATIAPDGLPAAGHAMLLHAPIVLTRELRRNRPLPVQWDRKPRLLFAFASPADLEPVPALDHLEALRCALHPFVKRNDDAAQRRKSVEGMLTVLPDASLERLREACRDGGYTHVHLLAHGAPLDATQTRRWGLALAADHDAQEAAVVDGASLALALQAGSDGCARRAPPTVVTLATCDSANQETVVTPGGSIAYELHEHGVPWVLASQFPLWMRASTLVAETFYRGVLAGEDPRCVLHGLRRALRVHARDTHDWAAIVVYAQVPPDFDAQVDRFRGGRVKARVDICFDRMDVLVGRFTQTSAGPEDGAAVANEGLRQEFDALCAEIRALQDAWIDDLPAAPPSSGPGAEQSWRAARAERLGLRGAAEKRIAIFCRRVGDARKREADRAYRNALRAYEQARNVEPTNHWVITQALSLLALPDFPDRVGDDQLRAERAADWHAVRQVAKWQLREAQGLARAWAHGTLAELELLGNVYEARDDRARADTAEAVAAHCRAIVEAVGPDDFAVLSTCRQFLRYREVWRSPVWNDAVDAALQAFGVGPPPPVST